MITNGKIGSKHTINYMVNLENLKTLKYYRCSTDAKLKKLSQRWIYKKSIFKMTTNSVE